MFEIRCGARQETLLVWKLEIDLRVTLELKIKLWIRREPEK